MWRVTLAGSFYEVCGDTIQGRRKTFGFVLRALLGPHEIGLMRMGTSRERRVMGPGAALPFFYIYSRYLEILDSGYYFTDPNIVLSLDFLACERLLGYGA